MADGAEKPEAREVKSAFRLSDPRQEEIYERLGKLVGPGPAAHFIDACRLMVERDSYVSTTNLVAHLLREIEDAFRDVLATIAPAPPRGESRRGLLASIIGAEGLDPAGSLARSLEPLVAVRGTRRLRPGHADEVRSILAALSIPEEGPIGRSWLRIAQKRDEYSLPRFAHRRALDAPRPVDDDFLGLWEAMTAILVVVLERFEHVYSELFPELDRLRALPTPTNPDADRLVSGLPNNLVTRQRFFEGLDNPAWIPLLRRRGVFRDPPAPVVDSEKGTISHGWWPASRYLARMAAVPRVQADVSQIFTDLPATENIRVVGDMLVAACELPLGLARPLFERLTGWVEQQSHLLWVDVGGLGALASRFLEGGEHEIGIRALRVLLSLSEPKDGRAGSRVQPWDYRELVHAAIPVLAATIGDKVAIDFFLDVLEEGLSKPADADDGALAADNSEWWLQALDTPDPDKEDLRPLLIGAVMEHAKRLIPRDAGALRGIVDGLVIRRPWRFLHARIALHLLRTAPIPDAERVGTLLSEPRLVGELEVRHEYFLLLRDQFATLPGHVQAAIVSLLVQAAWVDRVIAANASRGTPLAAEDAIELRETTVRDFLGVINEHLNEEYRRLYDGLVARHGGPKDPGAPFFTMTSHGFVGSKSPKTAEELKSLSVSEIRAFLESWQPPVDPFRDASPEGLAGEVSQVVAEDPERFAVELSLLRFAEPTYVRGLLQGFARALKEGRTFSWPPVLVLCGWVLDQPRGEVRGGSWGRDEGWSWTRGAINDLLEEGLKAGAGRLPWSLRKETWSLLERLTQDPSPADTDGNLTTAINSIRGRALERVLEYAAWVKEQTTRPSESEGGFDAMPEVRSLLDAHLDPVVDSSPAMRALYGTHIGALFNLDKRWLEGAIDRLFPADARLVRLRRAAWGSYLEYYRANALLFALLERTYREEVALLGQAAPDDPAARRLGQHLIILYGNGRLLLGEPSSLIVRFFEAPDRIRAHVVDFAGRVLRDNRDSLPIGLTERFQRLWEWRLEVCREMGPDSTRDELAAYISWFAAGVLDPSWAAEYLIKTAAVRGGLPATYTLLEALKGTAESSPESALLLLKAAVQGEADGAALSMHYREIRAVLAAARAAETPAIRSLLHEVISLATAKGCADFVDLDSGRGADKA